MTSPPNPFASSPLSSPPGSPIVAPTPPRSVLSAASGSPPPTHRASFPDPSKEPKGAKLGDRLVGPKPKSGPCCDRDREISQGEEISIVDAFKTTEGGKASYITYVIRLGVGLSLGLMLVVTATEKLADAINSRIRREDDTRHFSVYIKL